MSPVLVIVLIFVLAAALIALGLGLSRRAQRRGEVPPSRPVAVAEPETEAAAEPAVAPEVEVVEPEVAPEVEVVEAPEAPVEAPAEVEAPPRCADRLGKTRAAFVRSIAAVRGRGTVDDETWDELEETLLLADVGTADDHAGARVAA